MKSLFALLIVLSSTYNLSAQDTIKISDFKSIDNTSWKGTLTYKDYQSGNPQTIDATMQLKIEGDKIISNVQYTYEPNKNNKSTVKIKNNGTYFGAEQVVSFKEHEGEITFITTYRGKDNGKKADMYMTRKLTDSTYSISKKVVYLDTNESLIRNTYNFIKIE